VNISPTLTLRLHPILILVVLPPIHFLELRAKKVDLVHKHTPLRAQTLGIPLQIKPMRQTAQGLLKRHALIDLNIDIAPRKPIISQLGSAVQIDSGDDAHIALAPLSSTIRDLIFEEFKRVQAELRLRDLEAFAQELAAFVRDEHQVAVRFVLADFLHDAHVVYACEEGAP
jgi:hypothetical protein